MEWTSDQLRAALQHSQGCVVVPLPADADGETVDLLASTVFAVMSGTGDAGVVVDLGMLQAIDRDVFGALLRLIRGVRVLGAPAVIAAMQPGVASALVDLDVDPDDLAGLFVARSVEHAVDQIIEGASQWRRS